MRKKSFSVAVLMSTFNGEKYIGEQIDSIFQQKGVDITLFVRDDGSTDTTLRLIEEYKKQHKIRIISGNNIGWKKSFFELIRIVPEIYDYYAFSDQDDVWLEDKLISSVELMEGFDEPILCCSTQTLVDNELRFLKYESHKIPANFRQAMTNISCRGCSEVFNRNLLIKLKQYTPRIIFAHDRWVARVGIFLGKVVFDSNSHILYRQHNSNSAGNNYNVACKSRIKRALGNYRQRDFYYWYAKELLTGFDCELEEEKKEWLENLVASKRNVLSKTKLLISRDFISETVSGTLLLKLIMVFGLFQR